MMTISKLDYEPYEIYLHVTSQVEQELRLNSCKKEPETIRWLSHLEPGVLFDIGANVGCYSLVANVLGHTVHAFEPPGATFKRLEENILINPSLEVEAHPVLLGDEEANVPFSFSSTEPGAAMHTLGASGENVVNLPMKTLDSLMGELGLPQPEYLKIDTDGSELRVLVGAEQTLEGVKALQVEVDDRIPASTHVPAYLAKKGFYVMEAHRHHGGPISNVQFSRG